MMGRVRAARNIPGIIPKEGSFGWRVKQCKDSAKLQTDHVKNIQGGPFMAAGLWMLACIGGFFFSR
jgi:hypothetical protein